ncbi:hypothetical protein ACIBEA_36575 [Streptomyces sp. NPDC051555]|uniref:hypothetical protein n=1 Tax=Streptomyces sp. NPDC051555 TaxID=3365657 RepID=UPI00379760CB
MPSSFVTAVATRTGTRGTNADAAHTWTAADGAVGAAVIDGIGHSDPLHDLVPVLAVAAARTSATDGALSGLLTASLLVRDPGAVPVTPRVDAVAVTARARPGHATWICWAGDARAYGWDGTTLTRYTTDHNVTTYLTTHGIPAEIADRFANRINIALVDASPATVHHVTIPAGHLVLLTSDGIHDQITHDHMQHLVAKHANTPRALVQSLTAVAQPDHDGYRDDATTLVIAPA